MLIERKRKKRKSRYNAFVLKFYVPLAKRYKPRRKRREKRKVKKYFLICSFKENVSCKHHSVFAKCSDDAFLIFLDPDVLFASSGTHCNWKPASPAFLMVLVCRDTQCIFLYKKNQNEMHFPEFVMHKETKAAVLFHFNYHFRHQANAALHFLKLTFLYFIKHHYIVVSSQWFHYICYHQKKKSKFIK